MLKPSFYFLEYTDNQEIASNIYMNSEKLRKSLEEMQLPQDHKQWVQWEISKQLSVQLSTLLICGLLDVLG